MKLVQRQCIKHTILITFYTLILLGCSQDNNETRITGRWYKQSQIDAGQRLFERDCATCHGLKAEGTLEWKQKLPDGSYPPPPLNGAAHAWHHSISVLMRTIDNGGIPLGGKMPGFKGKFSDKEKLELISYFQSYWSDDIYKGWLQRGGMK